VLADCESDHAHAPAPAAGVVWFDLQPVLDDEQASGCARQGEVGALSEDAFCRLVQAPAGRGTIDA
jgi:hypothetical protein